MSSRILSALYYSYPAIVTVTLLVSYLLSYGRTTEKNQVNSRPNTFRIIRWLQAGLIGTLLLSILIRVFGFRAHASYKIESSLFQAQLACFIALTVYFGCGILPDPDGPFKPSQPHCYAWLVGVVFEISILVVETPSYEGYDAFDFTCSGLGCLRAAVLVLMAYMFRIQRKATDPGTSATDVERQGLIRVDTSTKYGAMVANEKPQVSPPGWLDYFYGFRRLFPYICMPSDSRNEQLVTVFCFILLLLQRVINVMVPRQLGLLVEGLGYNTIPYSKIALYCIYRGLQGQQGIIGSLRAILWIPISQSLYLRLTEATYSHVLLLSLDFHLSKRIGEVMSALGKGESLNTFLDGFAFQLFPMVFDLAIAAVWLFISFDAFYSIIVVAVMWNYVFVTIYMAKYRGKARREMTTRDRNMEAAKTDAIMAYETVHYNGAFSVEISKFKTLVKAFQEAEYSVLFSLNALNVTQNSIFIFGVVLVCSLSAYQISVGVVKVHDFVTLITYFAQLQAPLAFFGSFYNQVQNNLVDAERMLQLFNTKLDVIDNPEAKPVKSIQGRVTVSNLSFTYGNGRNALDEISFTVEPGTSTAIVGESGSGKSTILKLLYRFYNPTRGSYLVDGVDTQDITMDSLRAKIGVVPQDTILFNETIMYNLLYARLEATEEEVFDACRAANIHEKILGFLDGYHTVVGERGLKLSGGEKQRVAIARAILKNPQILLLDEATASLDTHTEKLIQGSLDMITRGRTTITIAHRLSTITRADQIVVLHLGRIVERGNHRELLSLGGRYCAMWEKQTQIGQSDEQI